MYSKILVPLDGSEFAESALEPAFGLAQKFGSEVILLRVAVPEELLVGLPSLATRFHELRVAENQRDQGEAEAYLHGIKMRWLGADVPVRTEVQTYPLLRANEALAALRKGEVRGVAVLEIAERGIAEIEIAE